MRAAVVLFCLFPLFLLLIFFGVFWLPFLGRGVANHWVKDANRILERVRVKMKGQEDHSGEALSVAGHVAHLINVARDPAQLSRMYHGWAAFV